MPDPYPQPGTVVLGLIAAIFVAAAPTVLLGSLSLYAFPIALIIATAHVVLLATPAYLLLRSRYEATYGICALTGLLIGAVPYAVIALWYGAFDPHGGWSHSVSLDDFIPSLIFGAIGIAGGLVFRRVIGPDDFNVGPRSGSYR